MLVLLIALGQLHLLPVEWAFGRVRVTLAALYKRVLPSQATPCGTTKNRLKGRWRVLMEQNADSTARTTIAGMVLHNINIECNDDIPLFDADLFVHQHVRSLPLAVRDAEKAAAKREAIKKYLSAIDLIEQQ